MDFLTVKGLKMAQEPVEHNPQCQSEEHGQHLCYIVAQGFHLSDEEEYKSLVSEHGKSFPMPNPESSPTTARNLSRKILRNLSKLVEWHM